MLHKDGVEQQQWKKDKLHVDLEFCSTGWPCSFHKEKQQALKIEKKDFLQCFHKAWSTRPLWNDYSTCVESKCKPSFQEVLSVVCCQTKDVLGGLSQRTWAWCFLTHSSKTQLENQSTGYEGDSYELEFKKKGGRGLWSRETSVRYCHRTGVTCCITNGQ